MGQSCRNHQVDETISKQRKLNSYTTLIAVYALFKILHPLPKDQNSIRKLVAPDISTQT